jgi:hypothetical protein
VAPVALKGQGPLTVPRQSLGVVLTQVLRCLAKECRPDPLCPGRPRGSSDRSGAERASPAVWSSGARPLPDAICPAHPGKGSAPLGGARPAEGRPGGRAAAAGCPGRRRRYVAATEAPLAAIDSAVAGAQAASRLHWSDANVQNAFLFKANLQKAVLRSLTRRLAQHDRPRSPARRPKKRWMACPSAATLLKTLRWMARR